MRKKGFTLVEILVVLGVIALLAAILLAVFSRQRQNAYRTTCQSNLKQIYAAFQMYTQDHDSRLPHLLSWAEDVRPYLKNVEVFKCPAANMNSEAEARTINKSTYWLYAQRFNVLSHDVKGRNVWAGISEGALPSADNIFMLADAAGTGYDSFGTSQYVPYPESCGTHNLGHLSIVGADFATYHSGGANYLFADGHTKWLLPQAIADIDCAAGNWRPR